MNRRIILLTATVLAVTGSFFNQDVFAFAEQHENKSADKSQNDREFFDCSAYLADMQKSFPLSFYQNSVPKKD